MDALEKLKPLALLLLRAAVGVIFIFHGYPKLFTHAHETMQGFGHIGPERRMFLCLYQSKLAISLSSCLSRPSMYRSERAGNEFFPRPPAKVARSARLASNRQLLAVPRGP